MTAKKQKQKGTIKSKETTKVGGTHASSVHPIRQQGARRLVVADA
jgi:hypothetical protein